MLNLAFALLLCLIVVCCFLCIMDWEDYREEFPNGDPNKGSEGSVLIGGNAFSSTATHALR